MAPPTRAISPSVHAGLPSSQRRWLISMLEGVGACLLVLAVAALAAGGLWTSADRALQRTLREKLSALAAGVATQIDVELHRRLTDPDQMDGPDYNRVMLPLRRFRDAVGEVKYVYTMILDDEGQFRFVVDAAEPGDHDGDGREDRAHLWEVYNDRNGTLETAFGLLGSPPMPAASEQPHTDEWGTFFTGFAPLFDDQGKLVGVVGIDMDAAEFLSQKAKLRQTTLMGLVPAALASVAVGWGVARLRLRGRSLLEEALQSRGQADAALKDFQQSTSAVAELYNRLGKISRQVPGALYQFRMHPDGRYSFPYVSDGIESIHHVKPDDLKFDASPAFARIHPEDVDRVAESIRVSARELSPWQAEYRVQQPDGTYRWVLGSSTPQAEADGGVLWHGFLADVTERRTADEALATARRRFEAIKRAVRMGLWEWDVAAGRLLWDDESHRLFGVTPDAFDGTMATVRRCVHPDDVDAMLKPVEESLCDANTSNEFAARFRVVHPDGTIRWLTGTGLVLRDRLGRPERIIGLNIDVTAQVEAENELAAARERAEAASERAEAASRAKSEFLANMSHEIRTPLTAILGYADLLADDTVNSDRQQTLEVVNTIRSAGQHLLTVINDILDLSRVEAGRMTLERIEVNPGEVITQTVQMLQHRAREKGISLELTFGSPLPTGIRSDPVRLRQVILNLVGNAVKFTDRGSVRVLVQSPDPGRLTIDVLDTGVGLTEAESARLFSPFTQADSSVTRRHGGTGLGLTISRRLADLLGGTVTLEKSVKNVGSHFRIDLRAEVVDPAPWQPTQRADSADNGTPAPDARPLQGRRVLLVEDSADNRKLISFHLRRAGATVGMAVHGREALDMLLKSAFDLIVTDMMMPEMDGYTLARTLRQQGSLLPIVALTANAMAEDRTRCLEAGCNDYATKPIQPAALIATCARLVRRSGEEGAALAPAA